MKLPRRFGHITKMTQGGNWPRIQYRGEGIIEDTPEKIIPFMYLPEYRNKWDTAVKSYTFLERIGQDTVISHTITHSYGLGLISSRDFVDLINVKRYEGGIVTTNCKYIFENERINQHFSLVVYY
ncbi:stAR-related lipid transfer protein 6-like [Acipenser ruthenus]|uniref:stAR-related lipid transfer protein 6-like n=1 Tax=Acipenser ruthenus TaxID=7906 RepID=UPI0027420D6D|nr:stAR-related lipid transfer protein 6-like [Acipenser ruthenus]XP_058880369.1 stAR-related lipid transfer protein 6-like [Acipenser ruthenus]